MKRGWASWRIFVYAALLSLSFIIGAVFLYSFVIEHTLEISDDVRYYPNQQAQRDLFEKTAIDYKDIETYLDDTTMLWHSSTGNDVMYFTPDHSFVHWTGGDLVRGFWKSSSTPLLMIYKGSFRLTAVQKFCLLRPDGPTTDQCILAEQTSSMLHLGQLIEKVQGDPLSLETRAQAPFWLPPAKTTLAELSNQIH